MSASSTEPASNFLDMLSVLTVSPDQDKVAAIITMPHPTTITELRQFMGMVNQVGKVHSRHCGTLPNH